MKNTRIALYQLIQAFEVARRAAYNDWDAAPRDLKTVLHEIKWSLEDLDYAMARLVTMIDQGEHGHA